MDVSHLGNVKELGDFLDGLEETPEELIISKDMANGIAGFRMSSYPVGDDIRFRSILCKVKEEYEHKD